MEDCEGMFMAVSTSFIPINTDELCKPGSLLDKHFKRSSRQHFPFKHHEALVSDDEKMTLSEMNNNEIRNLRKELNLSMVEFSANDIQSESNENKKTLLESMTDGSMCKEFVQKYVKILSV